MTNSPHPPVAEVAIRPEAPADRDAIAAVVRAAFNGDAEVELVESIRASEHFIPELSLVAVDRTRVVGHVMISYVFLESASGGGDGSIERHLIPSLSPLAVVPELHGRGIGSALVRSATAAALARGEGLVVLEGSPVYYRRFGFEPASAHGLQLTVPDWAPPEAAQVLRLASYDPATTGRIVYPPAFDGVSEH